MITPEATAKFAEMRAAALAQKKSLNAAHILTVHQIRSGKYAQPFTEDQVSDLIGGKGANDEATDAARRGSAVFSEGLQTNPPSGGAPLKDVTSRASQAGVAQYQPPAGKVGGPAAVTGAQVASGNELFPPAGPPPVQIEQGWQGVGSRLSEFGSLFTDSIAARRQRARP